MIITTQAEIDAFDSGTTTIDGNFIIDGEDSSDSITNEQMQRIHFNLKSMNHQVYTYFKSKRKRDSLPHLEF